MLFLQRSSEDQPRDKIAHYIPPAVGCAVSNFLGNEGYTIPAVGLLVAVMAYIQFVLKPFERSSEGAD